MTKPGTLAGGSEDESIATDGTPAAPLTTSGGCVSEDDQCCLHTHLFENPGKWGNHCIEGDGESEGAGVGGGWLGGGGGGHGNSEGSSWMTTRLNTVLEGVTTALAQVLQNLPDDSVKEVATHAVLPGIASRSARPNTFKSFCSFRYLGQCKL